jgi:hypothetical protein
VTRWAVTLTVVLIAGGAGAVWWARLRGRSGSRASVLVSVLSGWLAAYVLWSLAGGLAARYGVLTIYNGPLFVAVAAVAGTWQYHAQVRQGRERGLTIFVAAQLVWLMVVIVQNGVLTP